MIDLHLGPANPTTALLLTRALKAAQPQGTDWQLDVKHHAGDEEMTGQADDVPLCSKSVFFVTCAVFQASNSMITTLFFVGGSCNGRPYRE